MQTLAQLFPACKIFSCLPEFPAMITDYSSSTYQAQLASKTTRLQQLLAPFCAPEPEVFASQPKHFRLRAEFRIWHQDGKGHYAMFNPGDKHNPVILEQLPIASQRINELMPQLQAAWNADPQLSHRLFQAEFLTTMSGEALVTLCYHRQLDEQWQAAGERLARALDIQLIGRARKQRLVLGCDHVTERLEVAGRQYSYRQPEGGFTQPNGGVNQHMLNWAHRVLGERTDDLLELYCGNGNFTLPLSTRVRKVLATEISKTSVNAALANLADNGINSIELVRLSAEELTQALNGVREFRRLAHIQLNDYHFGTVFVDPPRAGMDPDTCELVRRFERILYISCNPETLAENIRQLSDTHRITRCALFDQFPWTEHIEAGVMLERR